MIDIIRSVVITCIVSAAVSWFLTNFNIYFWSGFAFITVLQFIGWFAFSYYTKSQVETAALEFQQSLVSEISKNEIMLACKFCDHPNIVPINVDRDNEFVCEECGKINSVYMEIQAVAQTQPVDTTKGIEVK